MGVLQLAIWVPQHLKMSLLHLADNLPYHLRDDHPESIGMGLQTPQSSGIPAAELAHTGTSGHSFS